ncbi:MAG: hypothetical protein VKJ04_08685 [Vampirovibrionales bacterium]|nr:hypothetical protein [Vampirovibrionales bacterium]
MSGYSVPSFAYDYFPLKLYNLANPREAPRRADSGSLGLTSAFFTDFGNGRLYSSNFPSYPVNAQPTEDRTGDNFYFIREPGSGRLIDANTLSQKQIADIMAFDQPLGFVNTPVGANKGGPIGRVEVTATPETAPEAPAKYGDYLNSLQYSDKQLDALKSQATFKIPNVGLGLLATTDGAGNVTGVKIDMTYQGLTWREMDVLNPLYNFINRQDILLRATLNSPGANLALDADNSQRVGKAPDSNATGTTSLIPTLQNPLNIGLNSLLGGGLNTGLNNDLGKNPVLDRLLSLQPREQGLLVSGFDTQLDFANSRNLAASQARFDVQPGNYFDRNLQQLTQSFVGQGVAAQGDGKTTLAQDLANIIAQQQSLSANLTKQMDGRIPLAASLPSANDLLKQTLSGSGQLPPVMPVEDAMAKKSGVANPFLYFGGQMLAQREVPPQFGQLQQQAFQGNFGDGGASSGGMGYQQGFSGGFSGEFSGGSFSGQNPFAGGFSQQNFSQGDLLGNGGLGNNSNQQPSSPLARRPLAYVA